ncbi:MAG: SWIM zinc finger family protein [Proteobacteria bacterium]|nr:MAG: SWIM zinc finger family protein [Pseudomonadota bacterium]
MNFTKHIKNRNGHDWTLEWTEAAAHSKFGVRCSCSAYQKYQELCHHIWSALLVFDKSEQVEIAEARKEIESKALSLKKLSDVHAELVLKEAVDLQQINQWPTQKVSPVGIVEFNKVQSTGDYTLTTFGFEYADFRIHLSSDRKEFLDRAAARKIKRNQSAEKELLKEFKGENAPKKMSLPFQMWSRVQAAVPGS